MFVYMVRVYLLNVRLYHEGILDQCSSVWRGHTSSMFICMVRIYLFNVRLYDASIFIQCSSVW